MIDPPAPTLENAESLLRRGEFRDAHRLCLEVLASDPASAEAYRLLGLIASEHGQHAKAAELIGRAVALPGGATAKALAQLARARVALGRAEDARAALDQAEALSPRDALTFDTLGVVCSRTGLHSRAVGFFEQAAAIEPGNASFQYNLAAARQFVGDFKGAAVAYRASLDIDPRRFRAWSSLVQLERQTPDRNAAAALEALFDPADAEAALHVGHALAKTYEDLGDPLRALHWLVRAKGPKRTATGYDFAEDAALFEAAAAAFGPASPGAAAASAPIFVVGLPRSGTTLVDRILSSHPEVASAGELAYFSTLVKRAAGTPGNRVLDPVTLRAGRDLDLSGVGRAYLQAAEPLRQGRPRFVDKMPLNVLYAGLILRALPGARIVCLTRHPMDVALANYRQLFATAFAYYNYAFDLADSARYVAGFMGLVEHWTRVLPEDRFTTVGYEAIVADQEGETRRLLDFCGLSWDERCMSFHENAAPVATASSVQVRQPLYSSSIGRWRRYGDALAPMADAFRAAGVTID